METFKKRTFSIGAALAAVFAGAALCAIPASALTPSVTNNHFAVPVFAHHDNNNQNRDRDDANRGGNGNQYGWDNKNNQRNWKTNRDRDDKNNGSFYHRSGNNDRDDRNGNSHWGQGGNRGYIPAPPPPPQVHDRRNGR